MDSVGLGWTRLDPVELGPPLYYIKRGLLFKFLMEGLILERGLLLVYIRYKVHHLVVVYLGKPSYPELGSMYLAK